MKKDLVPKFNELMQPVFMALRSLGGSGKNEEILNRVISDLNLPDNVVDVLHGDEQRTELAYRLTWTKTYLKKYGIISNSTHGVWSISPAYTHVDIIDEKEIVRKYKDDSKAVTTDTLDSPEEIHTESVAPSSGEAVLPYPEPPLPCPDEIAPWRRRVAEIIQNMDPYGFERLTQRLLRKCSFFDVQVTKKTGDGGIDGTGRLAINGIFSFHVAFQCKRYKGSVGASEIRDFRGSLASNIEKGVMITTGVFSKAARDEASCPGKKQIDLIDGEAFIDKLTQYELVLKQY